MLARRLTGIALILFIALPAGAAVLEQSSPDGRLLLRFDLDAGVPRYELLRDGKPLLRPSPLGLQLREGGALDRDFNIIGSGTDTHDETWTQPWGEVAEIRCHYRELWVDLCGRADSAPRMRIVFRLFDDGLGFRYEVPQQKGLDDIVVMAEMTGFALAGEAARWRAWWIPGFDKERYENLYRRTGLEEIPVAHTPMTLEAEGGPVLCFHEAALTDFASMTLEYEGDGMLRARLVPWARSGVKVVGKVPLKTPWRTLQIADTAAQLVESYLVLNLNEPSRIADTSWIKPGKYVGIWWGMHLGSMTWGSGPTHGATTENAKRYLDFAADKGFSGVLVEGWNPGWDGNWWGDGSGFSFTEAHPDFDIEAVCLHAARRGVGLIGHHETGASVEHYEAQLEDAFDLYERLGVSAVKTGYVGRMCEGQWHHGQYMVRHYRHVVERAAEHHIMVDVHEPIKATGIRRTWPNMMTREGARGQEYNAWGGAGGNPPDHTTILPFTRLMAGPFDFTPGIFDLLFPEAKPNNRVNTTLAKQLALYVVIYSPLQMAADLPENYVDQPAFRFIRDVPCDWRETRCLDARIGDYVVTVRQDRASDDWYLGAITDESARALEVGLDFLEAGRRYEAQVYADGDGADWRTDPYSMAITTREVGAGDSLVIDVAAGGGQAIRFRALD